MINNVWNKREILWFCCIHCDFKRILWLRKISIPFLRFFHFLTLLSSLSLSLSFLLVSSSSVDFFLHLFSSSSSFSRLFSSFSQPDSFSDSAASSWDFLENYEIPNFDEVLEDDLASLWPRSIPEMHPAGQRVLIYVEDEQKQIEMSNFLFFSCVCLFVL